jgi:hypothetical protein
MKWEIIPFDGSAMYWISGDYMIIQSVYCEALYKFKSVFTLWCNDKVLNCWLGWCHITKAKKAALVNFNSNKKYNKEAEMNKDEKKELESRYKAEGEAVRKFGVLYYYLADRYTTYAEQDKEIQICHRKDLLNQDFIVIYENRSYVGHEHNLDDAFQLVKTKYFCKG